MTGEVEEKSIEVEITSSEDALPKVDAPSIDPAAELERQFKELKAKSEASEREKAEALRRASAERQRADEATALATRARGDVLDQQMASLEQGISAAEAEAQSAEEAWAAAMTAQDFASAARAQRRMQRAESDLARLGDAKHELASRARAPQRVERQAPADPVEEFIAGRTPRTAAWLRAHTDYITDPAKQAEAERAHYSALGEGIGVDTDEYFAHVEEKLGLREGAQAKAPAPAARPAAPVAPVGGGSNAGAIGGAVRVQLTQGEAQAATDGTLTWHYDDPKGKFKKGEPIGTQEFARRKAALTKQGAYDRSYTEQ